MLRRFAEQVLSRAGGAPLVQGNEVRILKDANEHFPAWLSAVDAAERSVFLENYIVADDRVGREVVDALSARARAGVIVRVICDREGKLLGSCPAVAAAHRGGRRSALVQSPWIRKPLRVAHPRSPQDALR